MRLSISSALLTALLCASPVRALTQQTTPQTAPQPSATQTLLQKAQTLESRGRLDLASLTWQQVLLIDPVNAQALAGLARAARLDGHPGEATPYLDRLRAVAPNDPNLALIQNMSAPQPQNAQLQQAAGLAAAGQYAEAMRLYRAAFGPTPPPGEWALAFYETEAGTDEGRPHAIAGLRTLVQKFPADPRYSVALARILTYTPATRPEGRRILERYPRDSVAIEALRQSLLWDAQNPASAADLRAFLALHPDPQLAQALQRRPTAVPPHTAPAPPHPQTPAITRTSEEQIAYRDLNSGNIGEAERLFRAILDRHPSSGPALAGMGYIRMQQGNFGGAISFLTQARQDGIDDAGLDTALDTARFWYTMGDGQAALAQNDLNTAQKQYQTALAMRPTSPEALEGLGGTLLKARHPEAAAQLYERFVRAQPSVPAAWRGLVLAQLASGNAASALATDRAIPPALRAQLARDPAFLQALAAAYSATGRQAASQSVLREALDLPFPAGGKDLPPDTQLQYAGLLQQANRLDPAAALYRQVLDGNPANATAWEGLIRVQHALGHDPEAMQTLDRMPPAAYAAAMREPGFDSTVAALFQAQGKPETAQDILEKSIAQQTAAGESISPLLQVQLAGIYLQRGHPEAASPIYRRVLAQHPDLLDAWSGFLSTLHASGHDQEALTRIQQLSPAIRRQLEASPDFLQTVAAIYTALGQPLQAGVYLTRILELAALHQQTPPADVEIQNAWLLLNGGDQPALYSQLRALGTQPGLTEDQRRTVQTQWATWATRRATQAATAGDPTRAVTLLNTAAAAFPENHTVIQIVAEAYTQIGQPRLAVALYRRIGLAQATPADFHAALTAALAAHDKKIAETWLRAALRAYPQEAPDPRILLLAAKIAEARGDTKHAAAYYRASLAAMPPPVPVPAAIRPTAAGTIEPEALAALLAPGAPSQEPPPVQPLAARPQTPEPSPSASPGTPARLGDYTPISANRKNALRLRNASAKNPIPPEGPPKPHAPSENVYSAYVPFVPQAGNPASPPPPSDPTRSGQSHPPDDDLAPQIPRPARPYPTGDSQGQQYSRPPRPTATPRRIRRRPATHAPIPATTEPPPPPATAPATAFVTPITIPPTPAPAPAPEFPDLTYPSVNQPQTLSPQTLPPQIARNTPPLALPAQLPRTTREQAELDLASLEAGYSSSIAATGLARHRNGTPGLDRLTDLEPTTEFSAVLARNVRAAIIPRGVFLNSGTLTPTSTPGAPILGTLPSTRATPQQIVNGLGGEAQLVTANYGAAVGYTPYEFPVPNITARLRLRPAGGPVTLLADRQPVTQTQLSYAGLRDPAAPANIWGGVVSTGATLRLDFVNPRAAVTFLAHGATLTGRHVQPNTAFTAAADGRFRLHTWQSAGTLTLGVTANAAHFTHNERGLTFGQGGYFSPNYDFVAAAPLTFTGHTRSRLHVRISAAGGVQIYQERPALFYPLDPALQAAACVPVTLACATYPLRASTSPHYAVDTTGAYRVANHWYFGAFLAANNTNLYDQISTGFFLRYLFSPQVPLEDAPTGLFPMEDLLPLRVP